MYCSKCGAPMNNDAQFCPNCGQPVGQSDLQNNEQNSVGGEQYNPQVKQGDSNQQNYQQNDYQQGYPQNYQQNSYQQNYQPEVVNASGANSTNILVWGIIGLAFACSFWLSLLGIIFSAVAKGKVKSYLAQGGVLTGKAKVGSILAKVGLIVGIVLTAIFVTYLITFAVVGIEHSIINYYL